MGPPRSEHRSGPPRSGHGRGPPEVNTEVDPGSEHRKDPPPKWSWKRDPPPLDGPAGWGTAPQVNTEVDFPPPPQKCTQK